MAPEIPQRKSWHSTRATLETKRDELDNDIKKMRQALKPHASFSSAYWIQNADIAMKSQSSVSLQTQISEHLHKEERRQGEFLQSERARHLREQLNALESEERLFREQAERLKNDSAPRDEEKSRRRAFIELFTTSKIGLAITSTGRGRRDSSNPDPRRDFLWCPILKSWVMSKHTTAAHLFAYMHGQEVMDSIFGVMDSPELFSPRNGMIISDAVEEVFDKGFMAIVPRLPDRPTPEQLQLWHSSEVKEYKVRILDLNNPEVHKVIRPESDQTWKDLDGTNVEFRSSFRPRARYLYFNYCIQILRRAWKAERSAAEQMRREFNAGFWGTRGRYLPRSMLRAFVEELGHGYEELSAGASDNEDTANPEDKDLLIAVASRQVTVPLDEGEDEDDDEGDDEDDDEGDDEDDGEEWEGWDDIVAGPIGH